MRNRIRNARPRCAGWSRPPSLASLPEHRAGTAVCCDVSGVTGVVDQLVSRERLRDRRWLRGVGQRESAKATSALTSCGYADNMLPFPGTCVFPRPWRAESAAVVLLPHPSARRQPAAGRGIASSAPKVSDTTANIADVACQSLGRPAGRRAAACPARNIVWATSSRAGVGASSCKTRSNSFKSSPRWNFGSMGLLTFHATSSVRPGSAGAPYLSRHPTPAQSARTTDHPRSAQ